MQKTLRFTVVLFLTTLFANNCRSITFIEPSKEKSLLIFVAFDTKEGLTKQKAHLIQESISSRIKQSFKGIVQIKEVKLVDSLKYINLENQTSQNSIASLLITYENGSYIIKINFTDNQLNHVFPTQKATCENRDEIPLKILELLKEYLGPKVLITKKISENLYELQIEIPTSLKSNYTLPKKGDYFAILKKLQTKKSNNIYKWTVLEIADAVVSNEKNLLVNARLYSGIELPDLIGLRVIKIPNGVIDVRFKILPKAQNQEVINPENYFPVNVVLRSSSKVGKTQEKSVLKTNDQGVFTFSNDSDQTFLGVAFVEVIRKNITVAQFPFFKISNEQESITLNFEPEKPYEKQKHILLLQVNDQLAFMGALFRELNKPNFNDEELTTRIEKIAKLAKFTIEKTNNIKIGFQDLKLKWPDITTDTEFKFGEKKLDALLGYIKELNSYQERLVKVETDKNSPLRKTLDYKISEAKRMVGNGDLLQAIALLESISKDAPEVQSDIQDFKALWFNKSPIVQEARKFLFDSLPNLSISELTKQRAKLISSVDACIAESDTAGLLKYQKHSRDLYLQLDPSQNDPDKSGLSPKESLELITLLEEQNKRVKIFFESLNKKP